MIIFLNEHGLEEYNDWGNGLKLFWQAALSLRNHACLFRDSYYFGGAEFRKRFELSLAGLAPDVRAALRDVVFSDRHCKCWRLSRASSIDDYFTCDDPELLMNDDSLCEAAERQLLSQSFVGTISASDSMFSHVSALHITKDTTQEVAEVSNATAVTVVEQWMSQERGYYDPASRAAPADFQTVLVKDGARFSRTNRMCSVAGKNRHIFVEVETGYLYYVDEGHCGYAAHLEVFDSNGDHLGEADIAGGELDVEKKVQGRLIDR